jgi:hypothetical protein
MKTNDNILNSQLLNFTSKKNSSLRLEEKNKSDCKFKSKFK